MSTGVMPTTQVQAREGTCHDAQATAMVRPKGFYLNDCSYNLDSIFVKHRFPPQETQ